MHMHMQPLGPLFDPKPIFIVPVALDEDKLESGGVGNSTSKGKSANRVQILQISIFVDSGEFLNLTFGCRSVVYHRGRIMMRSSRVNWMLCHHPDLGIIGQLSIPMILIIVVG
jgi:hypothetical protein